MNERNRSRWVAKAIIGTEESTVSSIVSAKFSIKKIIGKAELAVSAGFSASC
jgi:hypothetical protein